MNTGVVYLFPEALTKPFQLNPMAGIMNKRTLCSDIFSLVTIGGCLKTKNKMINNANKYPVYSEIFLRQHILQTMNKNEGSAASNDLPKLTDIFL